MLDIPIPQETDRQTPEFGAFVDADCPSLAELVARLEAHPDVKAGRYRTIRSAANTLARLVGISPDRMPAHKRYVIEAVRRLRRRPLRVSPKTVSNVKTELLFAIRVGLGRQRRTYLAPLLPAWQVLYDRIMPATLKWPLSRLLRFLSARGASPDAVTPALLAEFREMLEIETPVEVPYRTYRAAMRAWNHCTTSVEGWPDLCVDLPPQRRKGWTLSLSAFPHSFQQDLDAWLDRLAHPDPLDTDSPARPLRLVTVRHRQFQVRMFASALVNAGHSIEAITSLGYLVELPHFKDGLRWLLARSENHPTEALVGLITGLKAIARHHVKLPEDELEPVRRICSRLDQEAEGLRERTRERLAQFDDEGNLALLSYLPDELLRLAGGERSKRGACHLAQMAAALEILWATGIRAKNLAELSAAEHFRFVRTSRGENLIITIPKDSTKNSRPIRHELAGEPLGRVKLYLRKYRPLLPGDAAGLLFPGRGERPKRASTLSTQISQTITRHTGLVVHVHLFRSLLPRLHLEAHPGDFESCQRALGHKSRDSTRIYTEFSSGPMIRHFQETILRSRARARPLRPFRKPRRKRS